MATMARGGLDEVLHKMLRNTQHRVRYTVYNVVYYNVLDLPRRDVIEENLHALIKMYFDTEAGAKELLNNLLTSSSFRAPITTFVRRNTDHVMENKNCSVVFVLKELMDIVES